MHRPPQRGPVARLLRQRAIVTKTQAELDNALERDGNGRLVVLDFNRLVFHPAWRRGMDAVESTNGLVDPDARP
jgi:hypothetical protein